MTRHDNLDRHLSRALHHRVELIHFEPQQHAISVWLIITVADGAVMVFHFEAVQLQYELPVGY